MALKIDFGSVTQVTYLIGADAIMLIAGPAACALPLRRALTINPTDAENGGLTAGVCAEHVRARLC